LHNLMTFETSMFKGQKKRNNTITTNFFAILLLTVSVAVNAQKVYSSPSLKIYQITENTFRHVTYLKTRSFGLYPCNGLIAISNGESMVFDTPSYDSVALELINWLEKDQNTKVKGVVINHAHVDCLGGLATFHEMGIPSYASNLAVQKALVDRVISPEIGFEKKQILKVGDVTIVNRYLGEAHTSGNIVSYIKQDKVLFGGCLLKSLNASKGNLNDADVMEWSNTVKNAKEQFPDIQFAVPGHGEVGGLELLDYTITLFSQTSD